MTRTAIVVALALAVCEMTTAAQDTPVQLGLKLESSRAPVDVVVIERLERPTAD